MCIPIIFLREQLEYAEESAIRRALEEFDGNKRLAMRQLDMKKSTFYERLQHYGIS